MRIPRADAGADRIYDGLRAAFGDGSPRASGYLSEYSFLRERDLILEALGERPGTTVDVACGAGLVSLPLARAGRRVVGVDFNAAACAEARRNGIAAVRGDAFGLPLATGVADVVLNVEFAQQYDLALVERMLREASRVLRPGGRLLIAWPNRRAVIHRIAAAVLRLLNHPRGRGSIPLVGHAPPAMRAASDRAGFVVDEVFAIFPPLRLRLRRVDGPLADLIGSSFVGLFRRKDQP